MGTCLAPAAWGILLGLVVVASGCEGGVADGEAGSSGDGESGAAIVVEGGPDFDFGTVEVTGENLEHTFTLYNRLGRAVEITGFRKTCGCLSVVVEPLVMPAGGEAKVTVELDTSFFTGRKDTHVVLEFDGDLEPLVLGTEVFMVSDYSVTVDPRIWSVTLPKQAAQSGEDPVTATRSFVVTEFLSKALAGPEGKEPSALGGTRVSSKTESVRVKSVGEWEPLGWRAFGYARQAEVVLELELPEGTRDRDAECVLEFSHRPPREPSQESRAPRTEVELAIRTF